MPGAPEHDSDIYEGWTPTELVREVANNAGPAGAGAAAELTRRLTIQLQLSTNRADNAAARAERLTRWVIWLTVAVVVLTAVLVVKAFAE